MVPARSLFVSITVVVVTLFLTNKSESAEADTSLYDFVAYSVLEDFVDIVEVTAWITRKVKDNIDNLLEDAFLTLTKQQTMLQPVISLAESRNRKDCSDGRYMNVTDIVFREYFNMNLNCPLIGQKMSLFFNEIHNITARVADIHRRYINNAVNCGPPTYPRADRTCLQNLVDSCREETKVIRSFMSSFQYDIDAFMDGQEEETFQCLIHGMSEVRGATLNAINHIYYCLNITDLQMDKKYNSQFVTRSMGLTGHHFFDILKKLDKNGLPVENIQVDELKFEMPKQPYYEPAKPVSKQLTPNKRTQELKQIQKSQVQPATYKSNQSHVKYAQQSHRSELHLREHVQKQATSQLSHTTLPWKIDPSKPPKYANKHDNTKDSSSDFDLSVFDQLDNEFLSKDSHTQVRHEL